MEIPVKKRRGSIYPNCFGLRSPVSMLRAILLVAVISVGLKPPIAKVAFAPTVSADQGTASTTVATAPSPAEAVTELLRAFVSSDYVSGANTTVMGISVGGLTWALVQRTNVQSGTAEIWKAFAPAALTSVTVTATLSQSVAASITVMSFTGVDTSGTNGSGTIGALGTGNANPGAPTASLITTRNGSLVLGVGSDWDSAIGRTVGLNQTLVHQFLPAAQDTYWGQMQSNAIPLSGARVAINTTDTTTHTHNLTL